MIIFKPSNKIAKKFPDIDFTMLSIIVSNYYVGIASSKKAYTINLRLTSSNSSSYTWDQKGHEVDILMSEDIIPNDDRYFIKNLLHEFRHFIQDKVYCIPDTAEYYDDTSHRAYLDSPLEKDARKFEKLIGARLIRMYYRMREQQVKLKELDNDIRVR